MNRINGKANLAGMAVDHAAVPRRGHGASAIADKESHPCAAS